MAAIGLVDLVGAPTGAQSADVGAELVSANAADTPFTGSSTNPSISDAGDVVVFTSQNTPAAGEPAEFDVVVRRSAADAAPEVLLIDLDSTRPVAAAISGDGCTAAYSAMVDRPAENLSPDEPMPDEPPAVVDDEVADDPPLHPEVVELRAVALCGAPGIEPITAVLDRVEGETPLTAPAMATDGSVIAWATPTAIRAYSSSSTPEVVDVVEIAAPGPDAVVGGHLDMTADGSTIVFEAGPLTTDPGDAADAIDPSVYISTVTEAAVATDPPVVVTERFAPSDAGSSWPTISGDGTIVVYQSDQALPIDGIPADGDYLVLADRSAAPVTHRVLTHACGTARPGCERNGAGLRRLRIGPDPPLGFHGAVRRVHRAHREPEGRRGIRRRCSCVRVRRCGVR